MSDDPRYDVLVSNDNGVNWRRYTGIRANSVEQAINRVRESDAAETDLESQFVAFARFRPRKMEKELVERWSLRPIEPETEEAPKNG